MDGLELEVRECTPDQERYLQVPLLQEALQVVESVLEEIDRGRHEYSVGGTRATDPVLRTPEFAGRPLLAADAAHEFGVHVSNQTLAQRELTEALDPVFESAHVVEDFPLILGLDP
jgi:hypothetical protein